MKMGVVEGKRWTSNREAGVKESVGGRETMVEGERKTWGIFAVVGRGTGGGGHYVEEIDPRCIVTAQSYDTLFAHTKRSGWSTHSSQVFLALSCVIVGDGAVGGRAIK